MHWSLVFSTIKEFFIYLKDDTKVSKDIRNMSRSIAIEQMQQKAIIVLIQHLVILI